MDFRAQKHDTSCSSHNKYNLFALFLIFASNGPRIEHKNMRNRKNKMTINHSLLSSAATYNRDMILFAQSLRPRIAADAFYRGVHRNQYKQNNYIFVHNIFT